MSSDSPPNLFSRGYPEFLIYKKELKGDQISGTRGHWITVCGTLLPATERCDKHHQHAPGRLEVCWADFARNTSDIMIPISPKYGRCLLTYIVPVWDRKEWVPAKKVELHDQMLCHSTMVDWTDMYTLSINLNTIHNICSVFYLDIHLRFDNTWKFTSKPYDKRYVKVVLNQGLPC